MSSSLYPEVDQSNPEESQLTEIAENLFPENEPQNPNSPSEQTLISIPHATVHLIDQSRSLELATGEFSVVRLQQGETVIAVLARIGDQIQWPLAKDEAAVKLDRNHYFFSLRVPSDESGGPDSVLNYGLTVEEDGQKELSSPNNLEVLDGVLEEYSLFSVGTVTGNDGMAAEGEYWTGVARDVEEYSSGVAKAIAAGSVRVAKGILWCGDLSVEKLKWGNEFIMRRLGDCSNTEISPETLRRVKR